MDEQHRSLPIIAVTSFGVGVLIVLALVAVIARLGIGGDMAAPALATETSVAAATASPTLTPTQPTATPDPRLAVADALCDGNLLSRIFDAALWAEEAEASHIFWIENVTQYPELAADFGDADFHRQWVDRYSAMIAVMGDIQRTCSVLWMTGG